MKQANGLLILGTRGIPASHGGFETFAEKLALHLAGKDWKVIVYCQEQGAGKIFSTDWKSIQLIHIPVAFKGSIGSLIFDFLSIMHSLRFSYPVLTLGYNTAIFNVAYKFFGKPNIINMDGVEWRRQKWGKLAKIWFRLNEWCACKMASHIVADNPGIAEHLTKYLGTTKATTIAYGAENISFANPDLLTEFDLEAWSYATVVARPEPENSIFEIVKAFSKEPRGIKLIVLGDMEPTKNAYHQRILDSASDEVIFLGALFDSAILQALRYYSAFYFHGHTVGGTNPSLVEALGAGNAVIAHDNQFNRWVAGKAAIYFTDVDSASEAISTLLKRDQRLCGMQNSARKQWKKEFQWPNILYKYEKLLAEYQSI